jgi:hypothetical protein
MAPEDHGDCLWLTPDMDSCVVTGGARGIGRGIAERMVGRGYAVVVTDVDGDAARRTAAEIGAAVGLEQDVRDHAGHRFIAPTALDHGRLAAWFNNAGVGDDGRLVDLADEQVCGRVPDVLLEPHGGADLGSGTTRAVAVDGGDDDGVPLRHHPVRDPAPDPARASGDDTAVHVRSQPETDPVVLPGHAQPPRPWLPVADNLGTYASRSPP